MFASASAQADVTAVSGSAYGYFSRISLFGGPPADRPCTNPPTNTMGCGPAPAVTLPSGGSAVPVTASVPSGDARYGPGIFFTSGPITVSTQGTPGPTGSVTTSTSIQTVNTSGAEVFTAANVSSSCTGSSSGVTGTTTTAPGSTLQTDDGDATHPQIVVPVPTNPAPNTTINGILRSVGDTFRYVFNEQIVNPDGSRTVNAGHQVSNGPTAVGDLIFGQSRCGVTVVPDTTAPETTIVSGPSGATGSASPAFGFSSSEAGSTFACKLDGPAATTGSYGACSSPKSYVNLADGSYTFSVRATDAAGNTDQSPASRTFTITTSVTPPPGGQIPSLPVNPPNPPPPIGSSQQTTPPKPPCSQLTGEKLARCQAALHYTAALTTCSHRKTKTKRTACKEAAKLTYRRTVALAHCRTLKGARKTACTKKAHKLK